MQDFYANQKHVEFNSHFAGMGDKSGGNDFSTPLDLDCNQRLEYKERTCYSLEHTLKVNCLVQLNPNYINFKQISF